MVSIIKIAYNTYNTRINSNINLYNCFYFILYNHMLIDKALSSDKPNGHWFEADWLHCKRDALYSNQKVDGSRLKGSTQACHS